MTPVPVRCPLIVGEARPIVGAWYEPARRCVREAGHEGACYTARGWVRRKEGAARRTRQTKDRRRRQKARNISA